MFSSEQIFRINGESDQDLERALAFALTYSGETVKCFRETSEGLILCTYESTVKLEQSYPFIATPRVLVEQIKQYLEKCTSEDVERLAGKEPDVDGKVVCGWQMFHPLWFGENAIEDYKGNELLVIKPCWIVYSK